MAVGLGRVANPMRSPATLASAAMGTAPRSCGAGLQQLTPCASHAMPSPSGGRSFLARVAGRVTTGPDQVGLLELLEALAGAPPHPHPARRGQAVDLVTARADTPSMSSPASSASSGSPVSIVAPVSPGRPGRRRRGCRYRPPPAARACRRSSDHAAPEASGTGVEPGERQLLAIACGAIALAMRCSRPAWRAARRCPARAGRRWACRMPRTQRR